MSLRESLSAEFVEFLPDQLSEGVLYISIPYATTAHACACGCKREVVAPLSSTDWRLIFDGETVSLEPSIGNWSFVCQSHYWIERNQILEAERWSAADIDRGRESDRLRKARRYGDASLELDRQRDKSPSELSGKTTGRMRGRFLRWFPRKRR